MRTEVIKITDGKGFHYEVEVKHTPHGGFSAAYYGGIVIATCELGRIMEPMTDNDLEWERYEERFAEWSDEIKVNLILLCKEYFNRR